jgi:hypothetical protein
MMTQPHTERRKYELIKGHTLQDRDGRVLLGERERSGQETEPLELHRSHEETVCHESGKAFKVERRGRAPSISQFPDSGGLLLIQIADFYRDEVVILLGSLMQAESNRRDQLGDGIGHATKHL